MSNPEQHHRADAPDEGAGLVLVTLVVLLLAVVVVLTA